MGYQKFIQKFRSSHGVSKVQKFRSWEVQKFSWGIKSSDVQEFHKFHIFRSSQKFRSSGVQKFRSSTSSQLLGELNSSYLDVDLTNNDTVKNRASTHAVEKRFLKKFKAKRQKGFIIALLSGSCPKWLQIESFVSNLESNENQLTAPAGLISWRDFFKIYKDSQKCTNHLWKFTCQEGLR